MVNITGLKNATSLTDLIIYENSITGDFLIGSFLLLIFLLMLMIFRRYDFDVSLATSSFICFILAVLLKGANLIAFIYVLGFLIIFALTIFYMYVIKRNAY